MAKIFLSKIDPQVCVNDRTIVCELSTAFADKQKL